VVYCGIEVLPVIRVTVVAGVVEHRNCPEKESHTGRGGPGILDDESVLVFGFQEITEVGGDLKLVVREILLVVHNGDIPEIEGYHMVGGIEEEMLWNDIDVDRGVWIEDVLLQGFHDKGVVDPYNDVRPWMVHFNDRPAQDGTCIPEGIDTDIEIVFLLETADGGIVQPV